MKRRGGGREERSHQERAAPQRRDEPDGLRFATHGSSLFERAARVNEVLPILILAGVYQWTPLKHACLEHCRSPLLYLSRIWRPGHGGVRMGAAHGIECIGCCWALMLLLFAAGVMSLVAIASITAFVLIEKVAPFGKHGAFASGALLVAAGA